MNITHAAICLGAWALAMTGILSKKVNGASAWLFIAIAISFSLWLG